MAWNEEKTAELIRLAAAGVSAGEMGRRLGFSVLSINGKCVSLGIDFVKRTAAEEAEYRAGRRAIERNRMRIKRARRKEAAKPPQPTAQPKRFGDVSIRRSPVPYQSKSQLRAELAQAVRNTAAMPVE